MEETEKGWFIQWIDRDPKTLEKQAKLEQRQQAELDDEERTKMLIESQIAAGAVMAGSSDEKDMEASHSLDRDENQPKLEISLGLTLNNEKQKNAASLPVRSVYFTDDDDMVESADVTSHYSSSHIPAIEKLKVAEEKRKQREIEAMDKRERMDHWLRVGLIVKIVNKTVGDGKYFRQKGEVVSVIDNYIADVKVEGMALLRLDQDDLETVLPRPGNKIIVVNGRGRGCRATLLSINENDFNCDIRVDEGALAGREIKGVDYEDICKFISP